MKIKIFKKSGQILKSQQALILSFVFSGIFIGVLVAAQFQSSVVANSFLIDEINMQKELLESFDQDRLLLKNKIVNLRNQIAEARQELELKEKDVNFKILDDLKKQIGLTRITGAGVKINMGERNDFIDKESGLIHAADLRDLINLLRVSGSEGISINGQRIINSTTVNSVGNSIMINRVKVNAPYDIYAVVNLDFLTRNLADRSLFPDLFDRIKDNKLDFVLTKMEQISIPIYDGDYLLEYVKKA